MKNYIKIKSEFKDHFSDNKSFIIEKEFIDWDKNIDKDFILITCKDIGLNIKDDFLFDKVKNALLKDLPMSYYYYKNRNNELSYYDTITEKKVEYNPNLLILKEELFKDKSDSSDKSIKDLSVRKSVIKESLRKDNEISIPKINGNKSFKDFKKLNSQIITSKISNPFALNEKFYHKKFNKLEINKTIPNKINSSLSKKLKLKPIGYKNTTLNSMKNNYKSSNKIIKNLIKKIKLIDKKFNKINKKNESKKILNSKIKLEKKENFKNNLDGILNDIKIIKNSIVLTKNLDNNDDKNKVLNKWRQILNKEKEELKNLKSKLNKNNTSIKINNYFGGQSIDFKEILFKKRVKKFKDLIKIYKKLENNYSKYSYLIRGDIVLWKI